MITCEDCQIKWDGTCPLCKIGSDCKKINKTKSNIKPELATISKYRVPPDRQPMPITIDNFFIKTKGVFLEIQNIPDGYDLIFSSKESKYYSNKEGDSLVRVSNHWGKNIKYCNWCLYGYDRIFSFQWKKRYGNGKKIGIISLIDLKENSGYKPIALREKN